MALLVSIALATLAVVPRPVHPVFTVAWQLRGALAVGALLVAALMLGLGEALPATMLCVGAALVLGRIASERLAARVAPRSRPETQHGEGPLPMLSAVTHNCGLHRSDPQRVAEFLADCGADLIGVQEIDGRHGAEFARALRTSHPHQVLHPDGVAGIGLMSRYPIVDARLEHGRAPHPYLVATVDTPGGHVHVVVVHPPASLAVRGSASPATEDLECLAAEAAERGPAILMGDLNTTDSTAAWDVIDRAGLVDAYRAVGGGVGVTFPVPFKYLRLPLPPLVRIDFVFASRELVPAAAHVGPSTSSDHLPLFASFALPRASAGAHSLAVRGRKTSHLSA